MDALLLEIKLSIEAIQVYISVQKKTTVKIYNNQIEATDKDGITRRFAFKRFSVQPNSCKCLKYVPGEGLHFRMILGEAKLAEKHPNFPNDADITSRLRSGDLVSFYCATCGHRITKAVK